MKITAPLFLWTQLFVVAHAQVHSKKPARKTKSGRYAYVTTRVSLNADLYKSIKNEVEARSDFWVLFFFSYRIVSFRYQDKQTRHTANNP